MKSVEFDSDTPSLYTYPISFSTSGDGLSVIHHDVRELESVGDMVYVTTKYGLTVIDYSIGCSVDYWIPQGVILEDSQLLFDSEQELYAIATASNIGLGVGRVQVDGFLQGVENWDWSQTDAILEIEELDINSPNNQVIGLGVAGVGNVFEISSSGLIEIVHSVSSSITDQLSLGNATVWGPI